ncbi:G-type lectin S-receptor-like serine/threonine-protein kinase At4g27290 isoform X1 [Pistacia vera]|uniref:G-type lectin S-receptor-like serine/threonine-protein kinase At4g27290 isoform X1 n=1 Tax=Pistacia vera TaxID=55513 RepID=UPI001262E9CB|nr:G-type lectin S-receptor-like serine/threonine-protein kinase At4g27290 isoform X1 [Pistacia vera]
MGCKRDLCISALLLIFNFFYLFNAADIITSAQFISDSQNESILSSNGNFRLGFFSPGKSRNRYVGIWPNKISKRMVVWVANRETPIRNSEGILKIAEDGNLAIFGHNKTTPLWSTNVSMPERKSMAKIFDSGNLILVAEDEWSDSETIIWQSFDYPTDTIIPGMKFGMNRKTGLIQALTSWRSTDDPAPGEFSCMLDPLGSPQFFIYQGSLPRYRCGPWNGRNLNGLPDVTTRLRMLNVDYSKQIDLINYTFVMNDNEIYVEMLTKNDSPFPVTVLEPTGVAKRMIWHESKKWANFWMAPLDLCDEYSRCGANAICHNENTMTRCECLPGVCATVSS